MATATTLPAVERRLILFAALARFARSRAAIVAMGTAAAFLLLGYHPYAEDGGIYAAALAARLQPSLFPAEHAFAVAHTGHSLFIPLLALFTATVHVPFAGALLIAYIACIAATVAAALSLAGELFRATTSQRWAVATLVASLGVPIAGTSLYLSDPYLTARSLSTPLLLWALALLLRRRFAACAGYLLIAFALHPMMTASSAILFAFFLAAGSPRRVFAVTTIAVGTLLTMAMLHLLLGADNAAVHAASVTRSYWFLSRWAWYEVAGMLAPPLLLSVIALRRRQCEALKPVARQLVLAVLFAMAAVSLGALLFVHPGNPSMLLARLQPLRLLHTVYLMFVLLLGGVAGGQRIFREAVVGCVLCAAGGIGLLSMQRSLYSHAAHIELPWRASGSEYQQAFVWARDHTPEDALFALDANYTSAPGEDTQLFRAIALRSSLPDAAKDGGIASVVPRLAPEWQRAVRAQTGFAAATDAERLARVRPLGATWAVLPITAATQFDCPYVNAVAKVCRLP